MRFDCCVCVSLILWVLVLVCHRLLLSLRQRADYSYICSSVRKVRASGNESYAGRKQDIGSRRKHLKKMLGSKKYKLVQRHIFLAVHFRTSNSCVRLLVEYYVKFGTR